MVAACPRCGEARTTTTDPCPACGYAPEHPGVLGAYRQGAVTLVRQPRLLLPYLAPVLLLLVGQLAVLRLEGAGSADGVRVGLASLAVLLVHLWWLLVAIGWTTRAVTGGTLPAAPPGTVVSASALATLVTLVPLGLLGAVLSWQPGGGWGAVAGLLGFALLVVSIVTLGRVAGVPVQAAMVPASAAQALGEGNRRGRENGGLGFVFLFLVVVATVIFLQAVAVVAGLVELPRSARLGLTTAVLWLLEAWLGVALAHGLWPQGGSLRSFTCPRCGDQATAASGRGRCSCGLEGPFFPGRATP